jgi:prepilin-type N-terminal cleavage/methylation domain-containing protein
MMPHPNRLAGFTLLEVVVAMTIGGLVLLLATGFLPPLNDATTRIRAIESTAGREARVRRWLELAFSSLDANDRGGVSFDGQAAQLVFRARMLNSRGWFEPTSVQLYLENSDLMARLGNGRQLTLLNRIQEAQWDYLAEPGEYPKWGAAWSGASTAPGGVRLRFIRSTNRPTPIVVDTLIFRVRGPG